MSTTLLQQGQENAAVRANSEKILGNLGMAMEKLANSNVIQAETNSPTLNIKIDLVEFIGADRSIWPTWEVQARGKAQSCGPD